MLRIVKTVFADEELGLGTIKTPGPFGNLIDLLTGKSGTEGATFALTRFTSLISSIVGIITVGAALWFLTQIFVAGINWLSSGGDKNAIAQAQSRMVNAIIGLVIVVFAVAFVSLAGAILGIDILLSNPGKIIEQLNPNR